MKHFFPLIIFVLASLLNSCEKDEKAPGGQPGSLSIEIGLIIQDADLDRGLKSTQALEDYTVGIFKVDGSEVMSFPSVLSMPDTIALDPGLYYVEVHSDNDLPAAFENPYYYGNSGIFTINSGVNHSVEVTCRLANTIVSVVYSETVRNGFNDYETTVSTELDSLIFAADETRFGYFRTLPLEVLVELTYLNPDASETRKVLSGNIPDPLPNHHYQVMINATVDNGMASFQVLLDESEIPVEVIEISEGQEDPPPPPAAELPYGSILITEIMPDPVALSDTEGEWFEIYNNSAETINLQNLVITRDETNVHTIAGSIELLPGEYIALTRTVTSTDAMFSYQYGSDIVLPNSGAVISLFNPGTDTQPGSLIFSIDYGDASFSTAAGASVSLDPGSFNPVDAVSGAFWCISTSVYGTGDAGTPGAVNDICVQ